MIVNNELNNKKNNHKNKLPYSIDYSKINKDALFVEKTNDVENNIFFNTLFGSFLPTEEEEEKEKESFPCQYTIAFLDPYSLSLLFSPSEVKYSHNNIKKKEYPLFSPLSSTFLFINKNKKSKDFLYFVYQDYFSGNVDGVTCSFQGKEYNPSLQTDNCQFYCIPIDYNLIKDNKDDQLFDHRIEKNSYQNYFNSLKKVQYYNTLYINKKVIINNDYPSYSWILVNLFYFDTSEREQIKLSAQENTKQITENGKQARKILLLLKEKNQMEQEKIMKFK